MIWLFGKGVAIPVASRTVVDEIVVIVEGRPTGTPLTLISVTALQRPAG